MKINKITVNNPKGFRGLPDKFEIKFRETNNRNEIDPICLAGLNGSGKSNIMELISEIFFYLEAVHHTTAKKVIEKKAPFGFTIEYETVVTPNNLLQSDQKFKAEFNLGETRKVRITKEPRETAVIKFMRKNKWITLNPEHLSYDYNVSQLLPSKIIAYSSGQNELISNPFLRMDFFYFDEYLKELEKENDGATILNNRLFFMDYGSNAFVLLSNYLMKDLKGWDEKKELDILRDITRVQDVESFEIILNLKVKRDIETDQLTELLDNLEGSGQVIDELKRQLFWQIELPYHLTDFVQKLEQCSTYSDIEYYNEDEESNRWIKLTLYYRYIDENIKRAFQQKFRNGLQLFRQFYLLNLLNIYNYSERIRENVKKAPSGTSDNISELIPQLSKKDKVFYINALKLKKKGGGRKQLFYKNLSDGEHQFLHIIGSLMLMEEEGTIFLLDEPSTHFNPDWRSKFIHTANEIHDLRKKRVGDQNLANQLVMLSTHSPFVLSDSKSENVLWLKRENNRPVVQDLDFETYGASIDFIMKRLNQLMDKPTRMIPQRAYEDLIENIKSSDLDVLRQAIEKFGESPEKQYLYQKIYELTQPKSNDSSAE